MHRYCITSIPLIDANGVNAVRPPPLLWVFWDFKFNNTHGRDGGQSSHIMCMVTCRNRFLNRAKSITWPYTSLYAGRGLSITKADYLFVPPRVPDTMLATVTAVLRFAQYNGSISPTTFENTSTFPTWQPDTEANISKPHKCLQVLYEDIGDSR